MVSQGEAFCPGHVTAFFEVHEDPDPRRKGSRGAGLSLSLGVTTTARVREASKASLEVFVNQKRTKAEVTVQAARKVLRDRTYEVRILSETSLPASQGFGVSSAAALSTVLALDDALGLGTPRDELVSLAHETEVECGTGLGDVVPASLGGMDLRLKAGAPEHADVQRFPVKAEILLAVVGPEMPTKSVRRSRRRPPWVACSIWETASRRTRAWRTRRSSRRSARVACSAGPRWPCWATRSSPREDARSSRPS